MIGFYFKGAFYSQSYFLKGDGMPFCLTLYCLANQSFATILINLTREEIILHTWFSVFTWKLSLGKLYCRNNLESLKNLAYSKLNETHVIANRTIRIIAIFKVQTWILVYRGASTHEQSPKAFIFLFDLVFHYTWNTTYNVIITRLEKKNRKQRHCYSKANLTARVL